jgi:hypothetical protein
MAYLAGDQINVRCYDPAVPYIDPEDQKRAAKAHYEANKDVYKERAAAHRKKQRAALKVLIRKAKDTPCADCGVRYPYYVMQFDHVGEKSFTIGDLNRKSVSPSRVEAEIQRCEIVCANCHAERTHQRGQAYSVRVVEAAAHDELDDATLF